MQNVQAIIWRRQQSALFFGCILIVIIVYMLTKAELSPWAAGVCTAITLPIPVTLFIINAINYKAPGPFYRKVNRWVYGYGSRFTQVNSALNASKDMGRFINPLEALGHPEVNKKAELLDMAVNTYEVGNMQRTWASAAAVEAYYVQEALRQNPVTITPGSPDQPPSGTT
jgi:hypothetical protein